VRDPSAVVEHEASTSKIGEDQLFYFQQRGIDAEKVGAATCVAYFGEGDAGLISMYVLPAPHRLSA
jgi:Fe-S cluster assembly scaffold protein SufB